MKNSNDPNKNDKSKNSKCSVSVGINIWMSSLINLEERILIFLKVYIGKQIGDFKINVNKP